MKKEHYNLIVDKFGHCFTIRPLWGERFNNVEISRLQLKNPAGWYAIDDEACLSYLFDHISEEVFAEAILQYLRDTEILFI